MSADRIDIWIYEIMFVRNHLVMFVIHFTFPPSKSEEIFRVKLFELHLRRKLELSIKSVHGQAWSVAPAAQEAEVGESEV